MKRKNIKKSDYLDVVGQKLSKAADYLRHGPLGKKGELRDDVGLQYTFSNILDIAGNLYDANMQGGNGFFKDPVADRLANFSDNSGYGDVSLVTTVGAIDVTILTMANSLVPFVSVDRSMANPQDTIYYQNLVATQTVGSLNQDDIAQGSFLPPNNNVNLGPATATASVTGTGSGSPTISFNTYLLPGQVGISILLSSVTYTGSDFKGDGFIYMGNGYAGGAVTVNYQTGVVTFATLANTAVATATVIQDVGKDSTGGAITKVKSVYVPTQLITEPHQIILEDNAHNTMVMNKIFANSKRVAGLGDYTAVQFTRVAQVYTEDINRMLLKIIVALGAADGSPQTLSLASYGVSSFAETKNDLVSRFFIGMRTKFIQATNVPPTVCVTSSRGAAELESNPIKWIPAPSFYTQLNGFAGTFDGMPVFRHLSGFARKLNYCYVLYGNKTAR